MHERYNETTVKKTTTIFYGTRTFILFVYSQTEVKRNLNYVSILISFHLLG